MATLARIRVKLKVRVAWSSMTPAGVMFVLHNTIAPNYGEQVFVNGYQFGRILGVFTPKIACSCRDSNNKVPVPSVRPQLRIHGAGRYLEKAESLNTPS